MASYVEVRRAEQPDHQDSIFTVENRETGRGAGKITNRVVWSSSSGITARRSFVTLAIALVTGFSSPAAAAEHPDKRWGISIWGLSYHIDQEIDFDEANVGLGLRYYFNHLVFVEADALRNSNRGLAVPVSAGLDLKVASLGQACNLYAVAAGTVVYYQNPRTEREYFKAGPVPGMTLGCGRVKTNAIIVLKPSHQPVAVIAASLTILMR